MLFLHLTALRTRRAGSRILNQEEIDSLLGFDQDAGTGQSSGVMALINSAMVNYERLPMLRTSSSTASCV